MFCTNCGAQLEDTSAFCDQCGHAFQPDNGKTIHDQQISGLKGIKKSPASTKQRKWKWILLVCCAVTLVASAVLLICMNLGVDRAELLESPVLDYRDVHIEIGRIYTYEELLEYKFNGDRLYHPESIKEGEFWTDIVAVQSLTEVIFDVSYEYCNWSSVEFYAFEDNSQAGSHSGEDSDVNGSVAAQDGYHDPSKYKYLVRQIVVNTEGVSFAGIEVGDYLKDVLMLYPEATCASYNFFTERDLQEDYKAVCNIYIDGNGNLIDGLDYFENTKEDSSRPDLRTEMLTGDPMYNISFFADERGEIVQIAVLVNYTVGSLSPLRVY